MTELVDIEVSSETAAQALKRVLRSVEFDGADRLKDFLAYVVGEALAGRKSQILGKHILQDVYGKDFDGGSETANVVRVDAGRLRRRLDEYYSGSGNDDAVRVYIDKGGYFPRFEWIEQREPESTAEQPKPVVRFPPWVGLLLASVVVLVLGLLLWPGTRSSGESVSDATKRAARSALFEKSPGSLQAVNTAEEARRMMFPATEPAHIKAALALFEQAIQLDDTYYGGFAGASQVSSMLGGLSPPGPERDALLANARIYAGQAVDIAPTRAWSQSAMAFLEFVERNYDAANRLSIRAVELEPDDLNALEIDAIIAMFSGEFDRAIQSAAPEKHSNRQGSRFPWRNALGNSHFHLENYQLAIKYLLDAALNGEPVSEVNTAHLVAAYQAAGLVVEASETAQRFVETWPESKVDILLLRLFRNPEYAAKVIGRMQDAGWQSNAANLK